MRVFAAVLLFAIASASADPVRTDPTPEITVWTDADGAHIVTLVGAPKDAFGVDKQDVLAAARQDELGKVRPRAQFTGHPYWVRTRFVDGRLICEKFGGRPKNAHKAEEFAKFLFAESCS